MNPARGKYGEDVLSGRKNGFPWFLTVIRIGRKLHFPEN
jgi:hypothetical protein